jgi:hypothetical protein
VQTCLPSGAVSTCECPDGGGVSYGDAADAAPPSGPYGYFSGVWQASTSADGGAPVSSLLILDLAPSGSSSLTGVGSSFDVVVGAPQNYSVTGSTYVGGAFSAALHAPAFGCSIPNNGVNYTLSGSSAPGDVTFMYSGGGCGLTYYNGTGTLRRHVVTPTTPRTGVTGFYSGILPTYPTSSLGGMAVALELMDPGTGSISATLDTYNLQANTEIYLTGSGSASAGSFTIDLSGGGACATSFRIVGTAGPQLTASLSGTDCQNTYAPMTIQLVRH